jgi:hypothetical protein
LPREVLAAGEGAAERVELESSPGPASSIARLVLGGIADCLRLGVDELDDLQLAVERLLAEARGPERVRLAFEWTDQTLRTYVGPLPEQPIAAALEASERARGELDLRRVLETLVDSVAIEQVSGDGLVVRLEKHVPRP